MARRALLAATALLILAALWTWTRGSLSPTSALPSAAPRQSAAAAGASSRAVAERRAEIVAALRGGAAPDSSAGSAPASLRGTDIDGALVVDGNGRLVITPSVRRFFEYFFVASGEESDVHIRARIETEIRARLAGDAQQTAFDLLDRYVAYRERGRTLADSDAADGDVTARVEALRRLRRESFGARDAAALFADEDAAYAVVIEQRRIAADPALSDDERQARLAALEARLPAAMRDARAAVTAPLRLARDEAALREAGGSPAEVQALREQAVGQDAADRLAALDEQRAEWQSRVATYRRERAAIAADPSLGAEQREAALEMLRARHFRADEIARVRALDRIEATSIP